MDVVAEWLLDGANDPDVDVREPVLYNSISCLLASQFFALLAHGPGWIGDFPEGSLFGKCLEQTRW